MRKKILISTIIMILIIGIIGGVNATELKTSLNVIQQASETKYLENDQGYISKTIVDSNANTGEVTIELKLSNTKKDAIIKSDGVEIVFVIDNSQSMEEIVSGDQTRRDILIDSAKQFVEQVYSNVDNAKIGIVKYYGYDLNEDGEQIQNVGTIETANIIQELTSNKTSVINALNSIKDMKYELNTNTDAGLSRAKNMLSNVNANKFIVLFSDGVPNNAIGFNGSDYTYGGIFGKYPTEEAALNAARKYIIDNTKQTMKSINDNDINLISILAGIGELEEADLNTLNSVFGTQEKPTVGKFYNINDSDIQKIVTDNIYSDVMEKIQNQINKVKIVDYFPQDISNNFDFSYVGTANVGEVQKSINPENNTIEWNIETLKGNEIAKLRYKLKIKNMKNTQLLDKTISTNEKVVLTYSDINSKEYTVELTSSPKIQLAEIKEKPDDTNFKGNLPKTGVSTTIILALIAITLISIVFYKKYNDYKDTK